MPDFFKFRRARRYHGTMMSRQKFITAAASLALLAASTLSANARGGHGFAHSFGFVGRGTNGAQFAGGRRHGNDDHIKAASEERDRLLSTQIKGICRGC